MNEEIINSILKKYRKVIWGPFISAIKDYKLIEEGDRIYVTSDAKALRDFISEINIVKSPLVGTFSVAPAQDAPPFVQVGDVVKKGQVLAIVEAMKLMNDIESDFDGKIVEIFVSNGESVEFGQPLFAIE